MQYSRCQCGNAERWDSGEMLHPCQGCTYCKTTLARTPEDHAPLEPHQLFQSSEKRLCCKRCGEYRHKGVTFSGKTAKQFIQAHPGLAK